MPTYDFACGACGRVTEALLRKFSDPGPEVCPSCGASGLKRMLAAPNVIVGQRAKAACETCPSRQEGCTTRACAEGLCNL